MPTPADSIHQLIKQNDGHFPPPTPYATINMGTFDAAAGTFIGLTSTDFHNAHAAEVSLCSL